MQIYKTLTLDLVNPNGYNIIYAMQADRRTRFISIGFTYDGSPYTIPKEAMVIVEGKTANNKNIFHSCVVKDNMAIFELTENILQSAGQVRCVLGIYTAETNQLLHSIDFHISITRNPLDPISVTNSSEYSALTNTMMKAKLLINKTKENIFIFEGIKKKWAVIKLDAEKTIAATNTAKDNAIQATEDLRELEANVTDAEAIRHTQENTRESQEQTRQSNEVVRQANENIRQNNEVERQANEDIRKSQEDTREENETIRVANEVTRQSQEDSRQENENIRTAAETVRKDSESERQTNEDIRENNEATRTANEILRQSQEDTRQDNEDNRETDENIRNNRESERQTNEVIRVSQENSRKENEIIRVSNEVTRQSQENSREDNENDRKSNETTRQQQEEVRQSNTAEAIANAVIATQESIDAAASANDAAENADEKATKADNAADRADLAAEGCENIIAGTGFISISEKGNANGLATLDDDAKLTATQLPIGETTTTAFAGDRGKALEEKIKEIEEFQLAITNQLQEYFHFIEPQETNSKIFHEDGSITTKIGTNKECVKTFNADGSITEKRYIDGHLIQTRIKTFKEDGSIMEAIT